MLCRAISALGSESCNAREVITGKQSPTFSVKPKENGAGSQLWIAKGERSGLSTPIAAME